LALMTKGVMIFHQIAGRLPQIACAQVLSISFKSSL